MEPKRSPLPKTIAQDITSLVRECAVWTDDVTRMIAQAKPRLSEKQKEQIRNAMQWHDIAARKLGEYGIDVTTYESKSKP